MQPIYETQTPENASLLTEKQEKLFLTGTFLKANVKTQSGRVYPGNEVKRAVAELNNRIKTNGPIVGEAGNEGGNLDIQLDRVSHAIVDASFDGCNAMVKLEILDRMPLGNIVKTLLDQGIKLGTSCRHTGDINENTGEVTNLSITTVDLMTNPVTPNEYDLTVLSK